jgi:hypothetical protein
LGSQQDSIVSTSRAGQPLETRGTAEAIQKATVENGGARLSTLAALSAAMAHANLRYDASVDRSAHLLNAQAVTLGNQVLFRRGRYEPGTERGRALIAHELIAYQSAIGHSRPQRFVDGDVLAVQLTQDMAKAMTDTETPTADGTSPQPSARRTRRCRRRLAFLARGEAGARVIP